MREKMIMLMFKKLENELKELEEKYPFEDEIEVSEPEDDDEEQEGVNNQPQANSTFNQTPTSISTQTKTTTKPPRFQTQEVLYPEREVIIEKKLSVEDQDLFRYQTMLFGLSTAHQLKQDAKMTNGILSTKIVKLRRKPNPNALGYSNIRRRKPPYAL
ncbi:unnamed protein product [Ambrosiozyma monospora]|uniref:Unnamed protein product n=1 Tax=Ambrosiozyma monospora TaxID=43982 RepID=A0ACB5TM47_AMBMO|nr:unnamed protein product [Ambrosiozyma monospora]